MERSSRRRNLTYLSEGSITKRQGIGTAIEAADMEPTANPPKSPLICLPCHYTCATCSGPHDSQCVSCSDDAQLMNKTETEPLFYCYPRAILPQLNNADWHYKVNVGLSIILFLICSILLYFLIACIMKRCGVLCCCNNYDSNIKIAYNKLASSEKQQSSLEIEEDIHKALNDTSESESDDDLNL